MKQIIFSSGMKFHEGCISHTYFRVSVQDGGRILTYCQRILQGDLAGSVTFSERGFGRKVNSFTLRPT